MGRYHIFNFPPSTRLFKRELRILVQRKFAVARQRRSLHRLRQRQFSRTQVAMQDARNVEIKEEKPQDKDAIQRVGGEEATGAIVPLTLEDLLATQPDDLIPQLDPDLSVAGFLTRLAQPPPLSTTNASEDTMNPEQQQEDEEGELLILDPEHPLVKRLQDALNSQFRKNLERLKQEINEKQAIKKAEDTTELGREVFKFQEYLVKIQKKTDDVHESKANADARHRQAQDRLEAAKIECSVTRQQNSQDKANVSKLQAKLDKKLQYLSLTQGVSEDLDSKVNTMKNIRQRAGAEKTQAEEQLLKQDVYVERLTKEVERLTLQVSTYEAQRGVQAEQTQAVKEALVKAEMEMESLLTSRKHQLLQWSNSFMSIRRNDEELRAMQEAVRCVEDQGNLLQREIEMNKREIAAEQEKNDTLAIQLNWSEMDCATSKRLISQKQNDLEALQTQYSTCLRSLRETQQTLAELTKENATYQTEVMDQRKQLEKESSVRLELEDKIMTHIQQQLTHSQAAKYSHHLVSKLNTQEKGKIFQLESMHNDVLSVMLESQKVDVNVNSLTLIQKALDEETNSHNKLLKSLEKDISSMVQLIQQKQTVAGDLQTKIANIVANTGHEDLSPLQIQVQKTQAQIKELADRIKSDQQLWLRQQGALVELSKDLEVNSRMVQKMKTECIVFQQKRIRLESQIQYEERENADVQKNLKMLRRDLEKLNGLLSKNKQLTQALELENSMMTTDFVHKVKEAERESVDLQMKLEAMQEEKERLLKSLVEAEQQILLRERKILILKETRSAVDSEFGQEEIQKMKGEIHRMELQVSQLKKHQEKLMRQSEAAVAKREHVLQRKEALGRSSHRDFAEAELRRSNEALERTIQKTHKEAADCEQLIWDLEKSKEGLSERIVQQKQQLAELCSSGSKQDLELENLQSDKYTKQVYLVALQSRNKRLQEVSEGHYKVSSTSETVAAAQQRQKERLEAVGTMLSALSEQFPQHKADLLEVSQAVEAYKLTSQQ
ncbi:coiled-coil domain-containing protein 40 isoform X1 [Nothobranchius furzeri]|uniref:Coiled-coil domain 40 molecular ruler complex subunit n=2 Tax=Nothobranchius furzeri TaxID=105023 RepID=A0A8C6VX32_NOTFU|nr:coiled-coil domain-containing protein 40 isoform X1 [Nothobranchius furzeri]